MVSAEIAAPHRDLVEGERVGRFVILRDRDGTLHAVAAGSVGAMCQVEDDTLLMLPAYSDDTARVFQS